MSNLKTSISEAYKRAQKRAIAWIFIFFFTLLASCLLSLVILGLTLWGAFTILSFSFKLWPLIAAAGLGITGFIIVYFNWRFIFGIFNRTEINGTEIFEAEQPKLFTLIRETTNVVGTPFPKKVFLIKETNAYVFYDHPLKSLFFPTKKNLNIGVGLLNNVSDMEFKGILAHEFGHFSQKSMAIGNYVYNIKKIIYQMIEEKDKAVTMVEDLSEVNGLISFIGQAAILYTIMIEKIFVKIHQQLTLQEMALSREMEYNADQIATKVVGIENMSKSLIRTEWINAVENQVADFFIAQKEEKKCVKNYYEVLNHFIQKTAEKQKIKTDDQLVQPNLEDIFTQYQKIEIEDSYSSHPELKLRLENIKKVNQSSDNISTKKAIELLENRQAIEENFTIDYFIEWDIIRRFEIDKEQCWNSAQEQQINQNYDPAFNQLLNYFSLDYDKILHQSTNNQPIDGQKIFNQEQLELFKQVYFYQIDLEQLYFLEQQKDIKKFKYNGVEKKISDIEEVKTDLQELMKTKLEEYENTIEAIHHFFAFHMDETTRKLVETADQTNRNLQKAQQFYEQVQHDSQFMYKKSHEKLIQEGLSKIYAYNKDIKSTIKPLLEDEKLNFYIEKEFRELLKDYIENDQIFHLIDSGYEQQNISHFLNIIQFPIHANEYLRFEAEKVFLEKYIPLLKPQLIEA